MTSTSEMPPDEEKGKLRGFISKIPSRLSFRSKPKTKAPLQDKKSETSGDSGFSSSTSSASSDQVEPTPMTRFQKFKSSFRRKKSSSSENSNSLKKSFPKSPNSQWLRNFDSTELFAYISELKQKAAKAKYREMFGYYHFYKKIKELLRKNFHQEIIEGILEKIHVPLNRTPAVMRNTTRECYAIATLQTLIACPPFIQFLKNNECNSDIYRALQSIVAQCHVQFPAIYCTQLIRLLGFKRNSSECAEAFYRVLHETCLQQAFQSPVEIRKWTCKKCGYVKVTEDKHARIQLAPRMTFLDETNVAEMVKYKTLYERMELECESCEKLSRGPISTTCILSDVMLVTADITRLDGRIAFFEPTVNLGSYDHGHRQSMWKRAGVVHYSKSRFLAPSPAHISSEGHYVAVVDYGKRSYLMNDSKFPEPIENSTEVSIKHGKPAFAIYYRADWNNEGTEDRAADEKDEPEEVEILFRQKEAS